MGNGLVPAGDGKSSDACQSLSCSPIAVRVSNTILIVTNGSEILGLQVVFPDPQVSVRQSSH